MNTGAVHAWLEYANNLLNKFRDTVRSIYERYCRKTIFSGIILKCKDFFRFVLADSVVRKFERASDNASGVSPANKSESRHKTTLTEDAPGKDLMAPGTVSHPGADVVPPTSAGTDTLNRDRQTSNVDPDLMIVDRSKVPKKDHDSLKKNKGATCASKEEDDP